MNSIDLIMIVIVLLTVFLGYRKSFMKSFVEWISLSMSLWITLHFFGNFANVVAKLPGVSSITGLLNDALLSKFASLDQELDFSIASFEKMNFSKSLMYFFKNSNIFKGAGKTTFGELSIGLFVNVLSIILLFIITTFILRAIFNSFEYLNKMAGFNHFQKVGAVLFSFLKSLVYVTLIAFIVYNISVFFNSGIFYDAYHSSIFAKLLYNNGLIEWAFGV